MNVYDNQNFAYNFVSAIQRSFIDLYDSICDNEEIYVYICLEITFRWRIFSPKYIIKDAIRGRLLEIKSI